MKTASVKEEEEADTRIIANSKKSGRMERVHEEEKSKQGLTSAEDLTILLFERHGNR